MGAVDDRLAVDQHPVAIEDDESRGHVGAGTPAAASAADWRAASAASSKSSISSWNSRCQLSSRLQVQEHRAEPDRGPVHEDEFARRPNAAEPADVAMDGLGYLATVGAALLVLDRPLAVVEQWAVDKERPAVQHLDHLAREIAEAPALVGVDREVAVAALQGVVEVDNAAHERRRRKCAHSRNRGD